MIILASLMKVGTYKIKTKKIIKWGIIASMILIAGSIAMDLMNNNYQQTINVYRTRKDHHFRTSSDSPIEDQMTFKGLNYFPPDEKYKVYANVKLLPDTGIIEIKRNDGKVDKYLKYAKADFSLNNKDHQLILLKPIKKTSSLASNSLFVPFNDLTNGDSTYQGGRYLDIENNIIGDQIIIDFNLAYNPYCVYNYKYSCPLPPPDNKIDTEILAGEKIYHFPESE